MKILIASDTYIYQTSGAANVVISLAQELRRRGHDVKVLAPANERASHKEGDDFFIRSIPALVYPDVRLCPARRDPLLDELTRWKPELIHLHTEGSIARMARSIAAQTGAPLVMTAHTDYAHYVFGRLRNSAPVRFVMKTWGKRLYRPVTAVIAPSEKARSFAMLQPAAGRVTVIPNGIRLEKYQRPVTAREKTALFDKYALKDNGCTLVMITRVSKEKNILEILRYLPALLKKLPQAQLIIAGDGPDRARLEAYCAKRRLTEHVRFAGRVPPDEVYRYYALGNVFVSASTFEVHSLSYLEAMAAGLPLVCREDASLRGVLAEGENGLTYRTENEFVDAVAQILRDRALQENMRKQALLKAKDFSMDRFVDRTLALYEAVLEKKFTAQRTL